MCQQGSGRSRKDLLSGGRGYFRQAWKLGSYPSELTRVPGLCLAPPGSVAAGAHTLVRGAHSTQPPLPARELLWGLGETAPHL